MISAQKRYPSYTWSLDNSRAYAFHLAASRGPRGGASNYYKPDETSKRDFHNNPRKGKTNMKRRNVLRHIKPTLRRAGRPRAQPSERNSACWRSASRRTPRVQQDRKRKELPAEHGHTAPKAVQCSAKNHGRANPRVNHNSHGRRLPQLQSSLSAPSLWADRADVNAPLQYVLLSQT